MKAFTILTITFSVLLTVVTLPLLSAQITVHGYVFNAGTRAVVKDADVYYFDPAGKKISALPTNSEGRYSFQTTILPGSKITIKSAKAGYKTEQRVLTLGREGSGENKMDFYLYPFSGIEVTGHINDEKGKPIGGAVIKVPNPIGQIEIYKSKPDGSYEFNTFYEPGQSLAFRIEVEGYQLLSESRTIRTEVEGNRFDFELKRLSKFPLCSCLLYGGGASALLSGGMYWRADAAYKNYKDFDNADRSSDLTKANTGNRVSIVSAGASIGLLVGAFICKNKEKQVEQARKLKAQRATKYSFTPFSRQEGITNTEIGIAYHF